MKARSKAKTVLKIASTLVTILTIRLITMKIAIAMVEEPLLFSLVLIKLSLTISSLTQETISRIYTMTQAGPMVQARTILSRTLSSSLDPAPITQTSSQITLQPLPLPIQAAITTMLSLPLRMTTVTFSRISRFTTHQLKRTRSCHKSSSAALRLGSSHSICRLRIRLHRVIRVS
jgi:hypothetical protein